MSTFNVLCSDSLISLFDRYLLMVSAEVPVDPKDRNLRLVPEVIDWNDI